MTHIRYEENTKEVRSKLKWNIEKQKHLQHIYTKKAAEFEKSMKECSDTLDHINRVLLIMEDDLAELEATKED